MAKRYLPKGPFATRIDGVRYVFNPDYTHRDGQPGYPELPKGLSKEMQASFYTIDVPGVVEVVEAATAGPGEKRSVRKPKTKVKVAEVEDTAEETDEDSEAADAG